MCETVAGMAISLKPVCSIQLMKKRGDVANPGLKAVGQECMGGMVDVQSDMFAPEFAGEPGATGPPAAADQGAGERRVGWAFTPD
jgi:hypothetical protein